MHGGLKKKEKVNWLPTMKNEETPCRNPESPFLFKNNPSNKGLKTVTLIFESPLDPLLLSTWTYRGPTQSLWVQKSATVQPLSRRQQLSFSKRPIPEHVCKTQWVGHLIMTLFSIPGSRGATLLLPPGLHSPLAKPTVSGDTPLHT